MIQNNSLWNIADLLAIGEAKLPNIYHLVVVL